MARYLVLLREEQFEQGIATLKSKAGLHSVVRAADYHAGAINMEEASKSDIVAFDQLKIAMVEADSSQASALHAAAAEAGTVLAIEPERVLHTCTDITQPTEPPTKTGETPAAMFNDTDEATWGLQATRVTESRFTGKGVRVAVLDTGLDLKHPDFEGRTIVSQSFISGQEVQDASGHGTHTTGTSCGPLHPSTRRYGCASGAELYIGKVLSDQGNGTDSGLLAGINWAMTYQCRIVSLSLGSGVQPGEPYSQVYEALASRALAAGTLIIAAAGNDSQRPGSIAPVNRPANCPSIMAVAAVDNNLGIAPFSNGGVNANGGEVNLAAPGVSVYSSWPMPTRYRIMSGTSMATPHVSGIAALWLEARGLNTTASSLWQLLVTNARQLSLTARDVGSGFVQAPV